MTTLAWVLQILLIIAFLGSGLLKVAQPKEKLRERMQWTEHFSAGQVKALGGLETLAALTLLASAVTKFADPIAPFAALGLFLMMVGAVITHVRIKDPVSVAAPAAVLGVIALVLTILRFGPAPLS